MGELNILVADSEVESAQFLIEDLLDEGYKVTSFTRGSDTLAHCKSHPVDLILIDRNLQDIDGLRLCQKLRDLEAAHSIPIIIISSLDDREEGISALEAGASDFITKPFYYPILEARIRNLLRIKLSQEQLKQARDEAIAAKQSKSMLLANMSHEIRTPLNGILGLSSLLESSDLNSQQSEHLATLKTSTQLLLELINNILDFSKFEQQQITIESIPFDIKEVLEEIINIVKPTLQDKPVVINTEITSTLQSYYLGDPSRIRQVLLNLLSNAIKFTRDGEVKISIEKETTYTTGDLIRVKVMDTGIGMEQNEIKQLFQPYQQANSAIQRNFGGTGLGLAICKQIIELLGGEIGVTSTKDKGSLFWFTIKLDQIDAKQVHHSKLPNIKTQLKQSDISGIFKHRNIMIVEDNVTNQLVTSALLKPTEANIIIAENGKQCLDKLAHETIDLILMDGQMPVMDGFSTTKIIRSDSTYEKYRDIPIVAMTANAMAGDEERCLECGMSSYISKPIDPVSLYQIIHYWLNQEVRLN